MTRSTFAEYRASGDTFRAGPIPDTGRAEQIVFCNSASGSPSELGRSSRSTILSGLLRADLPIVAPDMGVTWGSGDAIIEALGPGPKVLTGTSHGGICALHYAAHHPDEVLAVAAFIPAVDLTFAYTSDLFAQRPNIEAAWGITYPDPLPAGADPALMLDALDGIPIRLYISSTDPASTGWEAYQAIGAEIIDLGTAGHVDASIQAIDPVDLGEWLSSVAA